LMRTADDVSWMTFCRDKKDVNGLTGDDLKE